MDGEIREALDDMFRAAMQVVFNKMPDEAIHIIGMVTGQAIGDYERQEEQQQGEWRTHHVDGYHAGIKVEV